ncbi:S8 family serine peptidase [Micromonospora sp. URMC 106]|uniref:S8 family peptidase n=1 Tax=Micromonospora sp. URMC 106 TaxID=3423408 RepID=UPI003F1AEE64
MTLITGDRVLVRDVGGQTKVLVESAPRPGLAQFQEFTRRGDRYVLPHDAAGLVRDGVLDRELFNVTGLIRQGYDDASVPAVPLLVQYADTGRAVRPAPPAGAVVRRSLPGTAMAALDARKSTARQFWGRVRSTGRGFAGDIRRVWLNGRVRTNLEQSVPKIGAPVAWGRGHTGTGVTVAVLDSGIDLEHPDFAGKVATSRDFSGKGTVEDGHGHGTHVASIVAGSGAAADGRYRGVAPGATLAVGKVLDDSGSGTFDAVLAGMQWAAVEARARVVNMSLGSLPTDGSDPMSVALNELTREHGTLFVVAAGNHGADETVSTPAAADAALAVGSVSVGDELSRFSSRGPRYGDGAAKPDLAAPGADIVAARPADVDPLGDAVGDAYQRMSGTSMAAPHVAGSAALLAQQHPDWKATDLKAALMSTAAEVPGAGPYAVGTGRVDVARATGQPVTATGTTSTLLSWPNHGVSKRQHITWRNHGDASVTLALSAALTGRDGQPAPAGLVRFSAQTVTVPAGGAVTVEATVTAQDGAAGRYSGLLTGRSADGTVTTRTALSVYQEEERYDLRVSLVARDGAAAVPVDYPNILIIDLDDPSNAFEPKPGEAVRLPRGRYSVRGTIETHQAGGEPSYTMITHPELIVDRDMVQTLDARDGKPVSVTTDSPTARGGTQAYVAISAVSGCGGCTWSSPSQVDPRFHELYAATVPGTSSPTFSSGLARQAHEPIVELWADGAVPFEVPVDWLPGSPQPPAQAALPTVHGGSGTAEDLAKIDGRGKLVLVEIPGGTTIAEVLQRTAAIKAAGAKAALVVLMGALADGKPGEPVAALPTMYGMGPTTQRFAALAKAGEVTVSFTSRPFPRQRYELAYRVPYKLDTAQLRRARTADLVAVRTAYHDNAVGSEHRVAAYESSGASVGTGRFLPVRPGQERVEYFTPGTWELFWSARDTRASEVRILTVGKSDRVVWNKAVAGPTFRSPGGHVPRPWAWRSDDTFDVTLPMHGDSAGRPRMPEPGVDSGSVSLYRDGQLVGTSPEPGYGRFDVPESAGAYRLTAEVHRAADWWPLWTKVAASWTFGSSAVDDGKPLPLLAVRLDPAVDLRNRAPGGQFSLPVYVTRQGADEVRISSLTVDVSYDDGRTWSPATVTAAGDHWNVGVTHPTSGYASLRVRATDAAGNAVEQSVVRAYAIGREVQ